MRPTLRQLRYLVALSETGRFGEAAERCHVSQPALSAQIAALEADLDAVLVERRSSGIALTPAGREIVARARRLLRDAQDLRDAVRTGEAQLSGTLRLGVLPSIGAYFLPAATSLLHKRYPALRLFIREGDTKTLARGLSDGDFDCTLCTPGDNHDLHCEILFDETLWVCAAPEDDINADDGPIAPEALRGKVLISLDDSFELAQICKRIAQLAGAEISAEYRGSSLDAVRQMAMMGGGVAVLPSLYALGEAIRSSEVRVRRIDHEWAVHPIALAWRKTSPIAPAFIELARHLAQIEPITPGRR